MTTCFDTQGLYVVKEIIDGPVLNCKMTCEIFDVTPVLKKNGKRLARRNPAQLLARYYPGIDYLELFEHDSQIVYDAVIRHIKIGKNNTLVIEARRDVKAAKSQVPLRIRDIFCNTQDIYNHPAICQARCKILDTEGRQIAKYYPRLECLELRRHEYEPDIVYNAVIENIELGKNRTLILKVNTQEQK